MMDPVVPNRMQYCVICGETRRRSEQSGRWQWECVGIRKFHQMTRHGGAGKTRRQEVITQVMSGGNVCKASYKLRDSKEGYPDGGRASLSCSCTPGYDPRLAWRRRQPSRVTLGGIDTAIGRVSCGVWPCRDRDNDNVGVSACEEDALAWTQALLRTHTAVATHNTNMHQCGMVARKACSQSAHFYE